MPLNISSNAKGILFIIAAVSCLSVMDGVTRYLTDYYNVIAINMFRYFFLFLFVISINSTGNKSVILVSKSKFKLIQILRGTILAVEMCFAHYLFLKIGLIETHAIFASCPLIVAALSVIFLGEKVGWRRWSAILIGFIAGFIYLSIIVLENPINFSTKILIIFSVIFSSIFGDLFVSKVKRSIEVKDFSKMLYGHGGISDRLDSLLPSFAICFWIFFLV